MPIRDGISIKNQQQITYNGKNMQSIYVGNKLVWSKIVCFLQFQTNSPSTKTFDPAITAYTGTYSWDLGNGITIAGASISYTYPDSSTKTVILRGSGTFNIMAIDVRDDNIVGILDLSNAAFKTLTSIIIFSNPLLTSVLLPNIMSGSFDLLYMCATGITGVLDLSKIISFNSGQVLLYSNPNLTGVTFANSISGTIALLCIYSSNLTGVLDLSKFTSFNSTLIDLHDNPNLTGVTFANSISMTTEIGLNISGCNLGYINLLAFTTGTSANTSYWNFRNNRMSAAVVNHMLTDINTISVSGYTGRSIIIDGTNAAPDTTSGGYNGVAAKASLVAKGFTVTTS